MVGHMWFHNSWQPILYGTIQEEADGSVISTHFDISPFVKVFTAVWLFAAIAIAVTMHRQLLVCVFPIFGVLLSRFGRLLGKNDEAKLLELMDGIKKLSIGIKPID